MMSRFRFFFILLVSPLLAFSQLADGGKNFIDLYTGERVIVEELNFRMPVLKMTFLEGDSVSYALNEVKYVQIKNDFCANLGHLNLIRPNAFALRLDSGKVNTYCKILSFDQTKSKLIFLPQSKPEDHNNFRTDHKISYYAIGSQDLKSATIKNLKLDLGDNPTSLRHIKNMRRCDYWFAGLLVGGFGMASAGFLSSYGGDANPFTYIGLGVVGVSFFTRYLKNRELERALRVY